MLREQRKDIFENMYNEATRYAKEIHKKDTSVDYDNLSYPEQMRHKFDIRRKDSIRVGKNRYGRGLIEQQDLGRSTKRSHPGYEEGRPDFYEKKPGSILRKQMQKDSKKGKDPTKNQLEEQKRSIKRGNEISDKYNAYYKNSNHGKNEYKKKEESN